MAKFLIDGGKRLSGSIKVDSSKNAILPIIASCILCEEQIFLENVPKISDADKMFEILKSIGCKVLYLSDKDVLVNCSSVSSFVVEENLTQDIRASIFLLGALLSRFKKAEISYPGGCRIGLRPISLHLKNLKILGVEIEEKEDKIICNGKNMHSGKVTLDFPSVGATENLIMASVFLSGVTTIYNSAKEPEIVDLVNFINKMGGKIFGAGTSKITIVGVKELKGVHYAAIPDRIVAGTLLIAGAITKSKIQLKNVNSEHLLSLIDKLRKSGCKINSFSDKIELESEGELRGVSFDTETYPGFPTDLQPQLSVLMCIAKGESIINENLFENRLTHLLELKKMGANVDVCGRCAKIQGVQSLLGANVTALDLRGGASLVLAGLCAKGKTQIENIHFIDRGYDHLEYMLQNLGADIKRIE